NTRHETVHDRPAWTRLRDLPGVPDLVIVCTPPATVPGIVREAGSLGARAAVVMTAGFKQAGDQLEARVLTAAGEHGLRLLGPNSVGLIIPRLRLNASFAPSGARPGNVAFVTQSGALATAVLEWAAEREIGFSCFLSLGNCLDIDIADVIDFLGSDPHTASILLYMESLKSGRKFMSAARAAARNKPLIIVKAGRVPEGAKAAESHTGALAGSDEVYDAAICRAGALRVFGIEDLFGMAEVLGRSRPMHGHRLAILTNGGGPGILATDALITGGGVLATLSDQSLARLDQVLPANWSHSNPVDIIGDATAERYSDALNILLEDRAIDAVLVVHAPTAMAPSPVIATALAAMSPAKPLFGCWLGGASARAASRVFAKAGLPGFNSIEEAVAAILRLRVYRANQMALMETPDELPRSTTTDIGAVSEILARAAEEKRRWLTESEAKDVLKAYAIPVVETRIARDAKEAVGIALQIGFPVALKVLSPDITHKSDMGGVALDLETPEEVFDAAGAITRRVAGMNGARLAGFTVQTMARRPGAHELIIGATTDTVFGPVVLFGHGGTGVEVRQDTALDLMPVNMSLARQLVNRTRVSRLLAGYRHHPPARIDLICEVLVRVSRLMIEIDAIASLDINPLLVDADGVIALDARIELRSAGAAVRTPPSVAPYPRHLVEMVEFDGQSLILRPIRPEDEPAHRDFFNSLSGEDVRFRFFGVVKEPEHSQIARFTQIDYDREMAFIAAEPDGEERTLGVVRLATDPARQRGEFAVIVRSGLKGRGLGRLLLEKLIKYCREAGIETMVGQVLQDNHRMLVLARDLGFTIGPPVDGLHEVSLKPGWRSN
ncbi:MAG: GNAT family N-acetyltransferase, partial [Wenzhouxiangella sp.]